MVHGVERASDVELALWLFGLAYARAKGTSDADLVERVRVRRTRQVTPSSLFVLASSSAGVHAAAREQR